MPWKFKEERWTFCPRNEISEVEPTRKNLRTCPLIYRTAAEVKPPLTFCWQIISSQRCGVPFHSIETRWHQHNVWGKLVGNGHHYCPVTQNIHSTHVRVAPEQWQGCLNPLTKPLLHGSKAHLFPYKARAWLEELLALPGISSTSCFEQGNELSTLVFSIWDHILIYIHGNKGKIRGHLAQAAKLPGKPHPKALSPSPPSKHLL